MTGAPGEAPSRIGVALGQRRVLLRFDAPTEYLSLEPVNAIELARTLIQFAMRAGYDRIVTITVQEPTA